MRYLKELCYSTMRTYEITLNDILKEYKNETETDVLDLCSDIVDIMEKYELVETLYYKAKTNSSILLRERTFLLLRSSDKFNQSKFSSIREEDDM